VFQSDVVQRETDTGENILLPSSGLIVSQGNGDRSRGTLLFPPVSFFNRNSSDFMEREVSLAQ
jgi:hypothetical protein